MHITKCRVFKQSKHCCWIMVQKYNLKKNDSNINCDRKKKKTQQKKYK